MNGKIVMKLGDDYMSFETREANSEEIKVQGVFYE